MQRCLRRIFLFGLILTAMISACASAQVPQPPISSFGDYECRIDTAAGISASALYYDLMDAPEAFVFSAYESPVTADHAVRRKSNGLCYIAGAATFK